MAGREIIINVDDHEAARYVKSRILSHAGFTVYEAGNGSDTLRLIAQYDPDLVLLDVNLPDLSGMEVCRRIKNAPGGSSVIVLQISASAITPPNAAAGLNWGADAYLIEPVDPEVLVANVKALLRLRRAERELFTANERLQSLNKELRRSNEDLQQFAFAASHDLQEPLRSVMSFVSLLERTAAEKLTGHERECLRYIAEGATRMRALIDDLLRYSQVGHRPASVQNVDLNIVFRAVLENLYERISESDATVTCDPLPTISGDEAQLGQVFQNLIGNAIKYARPGVRPLIHVSADMDKVNWLVHVRDNGIGIERDYLDLVFVPFKRLHTKKISGTGIGLAICRKVIEAHGGRIWVDSVAGEGSTFSFSLPITAVDSQK